MPKGKTLRARQLLRERCRRKLAGKKTPPLPQHRRPKTRADCDNVPRPCPYVGCRYHLFLEVTGNGSIQFPHGDGLDALEALPVSCALDAAEQGERNVQGVARAIGVSDYWSGVTITRALESLSESPAAQQLREPDCVTPEAYERQPPGEQVLQGMLLPDKPTDAFR